MSEHKDEHVRRRSQNEEDRHLVARFLSRRDEKSFRSLYRRHSPYLNQFVLRLVGGEHGDAEDVLQVAWSRAVERLDLFRWESSLRSWLTGIALNCSRELLRKRRRSEVTPQNELPEIEVRPEAARKVDALDLERAIANLPQGYREVLILHDIEGYTHVEIGQFLGIESGTSKSQLSRARRAMRMSLGAQFNETG